MRKFISALIVAFLGIVLYGGAVLAAWEYYFPTYVRDTSTVGRTYYPVLLGYTGQVLVDAGKIAATGLDTNMQIGSTSIEYMMTTTEVATVAPILPASGLVRCDLYTGYTPNQTNFPVVVGENGRVETADAAALEPGQDFETEFDGYVDTTKVHHPLVYKPGNGGLLVDVSAAGTITAGIINADSYDVTPGVFGAWTDVDVSNYIPTNATGVVVEIDTASNLKITGLRKNGSTDNRTYDQMHGWAMIGVDSSSVFEIYLEDNTCHVYLRGYTDDNWTFKTDAVDVSLAGALAWTNVDVTADTEAGAVAAIIEVVNKDAAAERENGLRKDGSTDNRHVDLRRDAHIWRVVGLGSGEIFEGYVETLDVDYYLVGYVTDGATFADDATDKSLAVSAAWTDVDCSTEAPGATYVFLEVITNGAVPDGMGLRENSSSDNITSTALIEQEQGIVKVDMNQVYEGYEQDKNESSVYLNGYTTYGVYPPFPDPTYAVSVSVGGGVLASGVKNITVTGTGGGGNIVLDVDGTTNSAAIGAGVTNTTNNWRFMSMGIPYMTDYYHTVGGVPQLTYEPDNMLTDTMVEDETNAFDGTIAWGCNQDVTIVYGGMETYEDTDAVAADVGGFDMPTSGMPSTWFGDASGVANLPAYDAFNSVATQIGMPVQTLYFLAIIGLAFGVALFLMVFTRSALLGVVGMLIVLLIGSSQTIIPMWIPFAVLIIQIGIMYLYRQVSY